MLTLDWTHSLHKQFENDCPNGTPITGVRALRGETVSAQLLMAADGPMHRRFAASVMAEGLENVRLRRVRSVPVELAAFDSSDDWYLRKTPGLYPDMLEEIRPFWLNSGNTHSFWLDVRIPADQPAGDYRITVRMTGDTETAEASLDLTVLPVELPPQTVRCTLWFHSDCLADYYGVPVFSEAYWTITARFMHALAESGSTMILTPIFTPPLDTAVGGERTTVQLADVTIRPDGSYAFGFDRLRRWIDTAEANGLHEFEMAHLFTQWGGRAAPKIIAHTPDGDRRIFGWDTPSDGDAYMDFLAAFLPALTAQLRAWGVADRCRFHLSDEPSAEHLAYYRKIKQCVAPYLAGFPIMDALSNYDFYAQGAVDVPVVALNHVQPFIDRGTDPLWVYYCCVQGTDGISNRFMAMPSVRNRILGFQMYQSGARGFLQWGFNFYNAAHSLYKINPFSVTDADGAFPAGDAFLVYPGPDGQPIGSIRQMVFAEAMQDYRLCELAEQRIGRDAVQQILRTGGVRSFSDCDRAPEALLTLRERLLDVVVGTEKGKNVE